MSHTNLKHEHHQPIAFDPVIDSAPVPVEDSPSASITPRKGRSSGECKSIGTQGSIPHKAKNRLKIHQRI
eukprot:45166-Amorphochlora_amoeboformis.AAC.1